MPRNVNHRDRLNLALANLLPGAKLEQVNLDEAPGLSLLLLNADYPQHALTPEQQSAVLNYPAYWCFCWASGRVLAQFLHERPEWVRGKRVLDFGSGSGVAGIAALRAGAEAVTACDIDPDALAATAMNAEFNGLNLDLAPDFDALEGDFDLALAADVLYDRENLPWLERLLSVAPRVLVADSRVRDFSFPGYSKLGEWESATLPDLDESASFRRVSVYEGSPG